MNNENKNLPAVKTKLHKALEDIKKNLETIKGVSTETFKTNGAFRWNPAYTGNSPTNIHRTTDLGLLINIHQYIRSKYESYNQSAKELNQTEYPTFDWQGFSWQQWEHDLKLRVALVSQKDKIDKLNKAKIKLERFLTAEDQLEMTLKELGY